MFKKILLGTGALAAAAFGIKAIKSMHKMPLIGDMAPYFTANSTNGKITFPCDYSGKWVVFFSHPGDFTPVCTSELIAFSKYYDKFREINTELLGLSVDNVITHRSWLVSISDKMGEQITFPIIDDDKGEVAKKYGMLQNDTKTVRAVFVICPKGKVRAIIYYPMSVGRNLDEILRLVEALQVSDGFDSATPANWNIGDDVLVALDKKAYQMNEQEQKTAGIMCYDWYFCTQKLSRDEIEKKIKNK